MAGRFDPYHVWLGIAPEEQPPHHYRLLGLRLFETEPAVIDHAADRQMAHVRTFHAGKHAEQAQRLLNELAATRVCLLNPQRKAAYDSQLRAEQAKQAAAAPAAPPPPPPHHCDPALDVLAAVVARDHGGSSLKLQRAAGASSTKLQRAASSSGTKLAKAKDAPQAAPATSLGKRPVVWIATGVVFLCLVGVVVGVMFSGGGKEVPKATNGKTKKAIPPSTPPSQETVVRIDWPFSEREEAALKIDGAPMRIGIEEQINVPAKPNAAVQIEAHRKGFAPFVTTVKAKPGAATDVKLTWTRPPLPKMVVPTSEEQPQQYRYTTVAPPAGWEQPTFDDQAWQEGPGAFGQGSTSIPVHTPWKTPDIYLRRSFFLAAVEPNGLLLRYCCDDNATIYINGVEAADCRGHTTGGYKHIVLSQQARDALRVGHNVIAVWGHQGSGAQYVDVGLAQTDDKPARVGTFLEIVWPLDEREGAELVINDKGLQTGLGESFSMSCQPDKTYTIEARRTGYEPFRKTVTGKENQTVSVRIEWSATVGSLAGPAKPFSALVPTAEEKPQAWRYSLSSPPLEWKEPSFDDGGWNEASAPFGQGLAGTNTPWTTPQIYLRRTVELPQAVPATLLLRIRHDDDATVWINGVQAAELKGRTTEYKNVPIAADALKAIKPGTNVLAVYCSQAGEGQYIDVGLVEETGGGPGGTVIDVPPGAIPPPAVAPFDEAKAKQYQQLWAKHLKTDVEVVNSIGMKLVLVPPGEFEMGTPEELLRELLEKGVQEKRNDYWREGMSGKAHRVRITRPFYCGVYEVTQDEYQRMMGMNPSAFAPSGAEASKVANQNTGRFPVDSTNWADAAKFCRDLSASSAEQAAERRYRLPTEAEWEYVCRAGTTTIYWGASSGEVEAAKTLGWFQNNASGRAHPVGEKSANPWGLFDVHGNLWEWCADWYDKDYYLVAPVNDPAGPPQGSERVFRGGNFADNGDAGRSAFRGRRAPDDRDAKYSQRRGFRVVCEVDGSKLPEAAPPAETRLPVPEGQPLKQAQDRVTEALKDVIKQAVKPEDKVALARELVNRAQQGDDAADRYATLQWARKCAIDAPDVETLMSVVDAMAAGFQADAAQLTSAALDAAARGATKADEKKRLADQACPCFDAAIASENQALAEKLERFGSALAVGDKTLVGEWKSRDELLKAMARSAEEVKAARAVLADNAQDAAASATVGRYLCLVKGDFAAGLPHLARGDDAALKALAEKELQAPGDADARAELGDAWQKWSGKARSHERRQVERRIIHWYFLAFPNVPPIRRMDIAAKINNLNCMRQKALDTIINKRDGSVLVLVRSGRFAAGGPDEKDTEGPFPVDLPAYYIGAHEITNRQYQRFMEQTGHGAPQAEEPRSPAWVDGKLVAEYADHPVFGVSWDEAAAYCRWAAVRLPSELEWEKAARGTDGRVYPWGNDLDPRRCRSGHKAPGVNVPPGMTTVPVTTLSEGCSPFGLYHTAGNVTEWCRDPWDKDVYRRYRTGDLTPPTSGGNHVVRGGRWSDDKGQIKTYSRGNRGKGEHRWGTGFRVAKDFTW